MCATRNVHIYATVIHGRISNRVHTELKPYRPGSIRINTYRNPWEFLMDSWGTIRRRKIFGHVQNFCTDFNSVLISV